MAKAMSGKELNERFRFTLAQMRSQMRDHISLGEKNAAYVMACKIGGAAEFARRLEILDWEQARDIFDEAIDEAINAAKRNPEGGCDEAC